MPITSSDLQNEREQDIGLDTRSNAKQLSLENVIKLLIDQ